MLVCKHDIERLMARMNVLGTTLFFLFLAGCSHFLATPPLNNPPSFSSQPPTKLPSGGTVKPGLLYVYQPIATDQDAGDSVTIRALTLPAGATFTAGLLQWRPSLDQVGADSAFLLEASDAHGGVTTQTWSVKPDPRIPPANLTITADSTGSPTEFHPFAWQFSFDDDDPASAQVQILSPAGATYNSASHLINWTPPADSHGPSALHIRVTNSVGQYTDKESAVTIAQNQPPAFTRISATPLATEGSFLALLYSVSDPEADHPQAASLHASITYQGALVAIQPTATWDPSNNRVSVQWTPAIGAPYIGHSVSLLISIADPFGAIGSFSEDIPVALNQPPVISAISGNPTSIVAGDFSTFLFSVTDPNSDAINAGSIQASISFQGVPVSPTPSYSWDATNARLSVTWTPALAALYLGKAVNITVQAADIKGAANSFTTTVTVAPNQAPTITPISGNPSSVQAGVYSIFHFNIVDPNNDQIDAASVRGVATYLGGVLTPVPTTSWDATNARATVTWVPAPSGPYIGHQVLLTIYATDVKGASNSLDNPVTVTPPGPLVGPDSIENADQTFSYLPTDLAVEGYPYTVRVKMNSTPERSLKDPTGIQVLNERGDDISPLVSAVLEPESYGLRLSWTPTALLFHGSDRDCWIRFRVPLTSSGKPGAAGAVEWGVHVRRDSMPSIRQPAPVSGLLNTPKEIQIESKDQDHDHVEIQLFDSSILEGDGSFGTMAIRDCGNGQTTLHWTPDTDQTRTPQSVTLLPVEFPFYLDEGHKGPSRTGKQERLTLNSSGPVHGLLSGDGASGWEAHWSFEALCQGEKNWRQGVADGNPMRGLVIDSLAAGAMWFRATNTLDNSSLPLFVFTSATTPSDKSDTRNLVIFSVPAPVSNLNEAIAPSSSELPSTRDGLDLRFQQTSQNSGMLEWSPLPEIRWYEVIGTAAATPSGSPAQTRMLLDAEALEISANGRLRIALPAQLKLPKSLHFIIHAVIEPGATDSAHGMRNESPGSANDSHD